MMLKTFNVEFTYLEMDKDYGMDDFVINVPKWHRSFPAIFKGEEFVGGFTELKKTIFQD
jgi:glutaredoxin